MIANDEYARRHGAHIREAFNKLDRSATLTAIREAEKTAELGNLSGTDASRFWTIVQNEFNNGRLVIKADNTDYHALLAAVREAIEEGSKG